MKLWISDLDEWIYKCQYPGYDIVQPFYRMSPVGETEQNRKHLSVFPFVACESIVIFIKMLYDAQK